MTVPNDSQSKGQTKSRLALLATMSELHRQPIAYDLACLRDLVAALAPDLLCAEITRQMWEGDDLSQAALEVREALAPVVAATDVVLIPIAPTPHRFADFAPPAGWREQTVRTFDRVLRWGQQKAGRPEAVHGLAFEAFCHTVCTLTELSWTADKRRQWNEQNRTMANNIVQAVRRDSGRRVLVAVQCQRIRKLEPLLKRHSDIIELVAYSQL